MAMMTENQKAQINVTPMIDILLVMIVIFLVITPQQEVGLKALVPQPAPADAPSQASSHEIVISVHKDRTMSLNQEPVELASLRGRLVQLFRNQADHVIFVRGDRDLEFARIAEIIDIARGAGLNRIALML